LVEALDDQVEHAQAPHRVVQVLVVAQASDEEILGFLIGGAPGATIPLDHAFPW
jgi:hypothetical protein